MRHRPRGSQRRGLAFLGPNGAGKTTTVEILEGYRKRTGGEVGVSLGTDPARADAGWRARIGVVLQESQPEPELSVTECLSLYAGYYPTPRPVAETIDLVGLSASARTRCGALSGGQQRRLDVALALIGDPELIFLDEPTTGFDPSARRSAWELIAGLRQAWAHPELHGRQALGQAVDLVVGEERVVGDVLVLALAHHHARRIVEHPLDQHAA